MKILAVLTALALVAATGGGVPQAQDLSTEIFPSEDELYQALLTGELSYRQYLILQEISVQGLDSTNIHLLDQIPNLSYFGLDTLSLRTSLENEQQTPFETKYPRKKTTVGTTISHRYDSYLDDDRRSRYRTSLALDVDDNLTADIKLRREYSGYERITARTLTCKNSDGLLKEVTFGNYSRRLGMGTVFGYRGKLLDFSENIDLESWLYPDNGAANGLAIDMGQSEWQSQTILSVNRDDNFRLTSVAGSLGLLKIPLNPSILLGLNHLKNRATGSSVSDFKYGINLRRDYDDGYAAVEAIGQAGEKQSFGALVTEGRHRFRTAEIKYAGWTYHDDYIDLSAGSKSAGIYHETQLETIGFEYNTRRSGQVGGLLKTIVELNGRIQLANSVVVASFNSDTANIEWLSELTRRIDNFSLSLDFLTRHTRRHRSGDDLETTKRRTRLTLRTSTRQFRIRTHIGYNTESAENDHISAFFTLRHDSDQLGRLELWSNFAKIDHAKRRIDYWYAFIRHSFNAVGNLNAGVKLIHTYRRGADEDHRSTVSFDLCYSI